MRECKQILKLVLSGLGLLAANCDFQIHDNKPVKVVIHDDTNPIPGYIDLDNEGVSSTLEPRLYSMTAADGTRYTCRLPVRTGDEESKCSVNNSLTLEQEFVGFVGSATLLENSGCYSSAFQKQAYESITYSTRETAFTLCIKSNAYQASKDGNQTNVHMYIPGSERVVDVLTHMDISHYETGIEPGTKGLYQQYEGGVVSYIVCNTAGQRTWLRWLQYSPEVLILETPLVCGKTVQDIIKAAYKFEVERLANMCLTFHTNSKWSYILCILQSVTQKTYTGLNGKGLGSLDLGTWDGKDLSPLTSASGKQAWAQHYINGTSCSNSYETKDRTASVVYSCDTYWGPITKAFYVGPTGIPVQVDRQHYCSHAFTVVLPRVCNFQGMLQHVDVEAPTIDCFPSVPPSLLHQASTVKEK